VKTTSYSYRLATTITVPVEPTYTLYREEMSNSIWEKPKLNNLMGDKSDGERPRPSGANSIGGLGIDY